MLSAVLVQLFGREVIDRLALGGFETADAIASAGPERLAEESGIPVALARRIIAVAAEESGPPAPTGPPRPEAPPRAAAPPDPGAHERHTRRPFRRPHLSTLTAPDPSAGSADAPGAKAASEKKTVAEAPEPREEQAPIDRDPFVDDVGLVSWMGFAARHGGSPASPLAVSDAILDPAPLSGPEAPPSTAGTRAAPPPAASVERPAIPAAAPAAAARPFEGSFWRFGAGRVAAPGTVAPRAPAPESSPPQARRAEPPAAGTPGRLADHPAPRPDTPRRRSRDGH